VEVQLHEFFTSALNGGEWSASSPGRLCPQGKNPRNPLDGRLDGPQRRSGRGEEKNAILTVTVGPKYLNFCHISKGFINNQIMILSWILEARHNYVLCFLCVYF
jgi:hypothetical protein